MTCADKEPPNSIKKTECEDAKAPSKEIGALIKVVSIKVGKFLLRKMFKLVIALIVIYLFLFIHHAAIVDGLYG